MIIGIDPGTEESGFVAYDFENRVLIDHGIIKNDSPYGDYFALYIRNVLKGHLNVKVCIEMPENFGMVVGHHVFDTIFFIGRFYQYLLCNDLIKEKDLYRIKRNDIKYAVIGKRAGKNSDIRAAMIARYGDTLKKTAKTYKLKAHEWQAFAAAEALWLKSKEDDGK